MHYVLYALNGLLMIAMSLVLGVIIARSGKAQWGLFGIGVATFIGAQVLHIPFNWLVERSGTLPDPEAGIASLLVVSLFLGMSAGLFEEGARYIVFRRWARRARNWWQGLMVGAGHGGIEAIILGLLVIVNMTVLFGIESGRFSTLVPADALPGIGEQVAQLASVPWYETLLGALERLFAITVHLAMSLMVLLSVVRRQLRWLAAAFVWHTLLDMVAVFTIERWGVYVAEIGIGIFALLSLAIIFLLRDKFPSGLDELDVVEMDERVIPPAGSPERDIIAERLDESRFE